MKEFQRRRDVQVPIIPVLSNDRIIIEQVKASLNKMKISEYRIIHDNKKKPDVAWYSSNIKVDSSTIGMYMDSGKWLAVDFKDKEE